MRLFRKLILSGRKSQNVVLGLYELGMQKNSLKSLTYKEELGMSENDLVEAPMCGKLITVV